MMKRHEKVVCTKCGHIHELESYPSINALDEPELKSKAISGELFTWQCPECGRLNLASYPLLYHDPEEKLLLVLSEAPLNAESCPEGYVGRQVGSVGELIEKIKIFDAGLDDVVIEMCKFVTLQELGRQAELKFLRLDGADSEMTFTYPDKGRMEMIAVGFNVYEDCAGILQRNPQLKESATGLARINQSWLNQHFR